MHSHAHTLTRPSPQNWQGFTEHQRTEYMKVRGLGVCVCACFSVDNHCFVFTYVSESYYAR
jgi:hypothetical protein